MAKKNVSGAGKRVAATLQGEAKLAYAEIQKGVKGLEKSIEEARRGLRRAEKSIEADARQRIQELRKDAAAQLKQLQARQKDASRTLKSLSAAAGDSWVEIKSSADSILADARTTATSVLDRFRSVLGR